VVVVSWLECLKVIDKRLREVSSIAYHEAEVSIIKVVFKELGSIGITC
jgi:hypothetical protein